MEPREFQIEACGLSNKYVLIVLGILTVALFIYLVHEAKKCGKIAVDERFRPFMYIWKKLKENSSTIKAIVGKNLVGKYNNNYFGILWNFISPLLLVISIFFIFISIKGAYSDRDYWTYICSGLFVVTMCRQSLSGMSFRSNGMVIKKLPNPGWSVALADTISNFITFLIPLCIVLLFTWFSGKFFNAATLIYLPLLVVILFVFCFGLTMLFSVVTILFNDVRQVMVTVARIIIWISPVFFYLCDSNNNLYTAVMCNPFAYVVEPFHQVISYGIAPDMLLVGTSILLALFFLILGTLVYLKKINRVRELV